MKTPFPDALLPGFLGARRALVLSGVAACLVTSGCSVRKLAIHRLGDALAGGGTTFASDEDPELIKAAVPFSLKLMESLLTEAPEHKGLLFATASGFTQYAYAFVQQDGEETEDFAAAQGMRERARRLYLRARDYGLRGLQTAHPGVIHLLQTNAPAAVGKMVHADVPLLYWTGASWAAAISLSKDNPELVADLPVVQALMDRALQLDEAFDHGALHTFYIAYEMVRPDGEGDPSVRARRHFERAMELSKGLEAGPLVSLAESVCIPQQERAQFESLLKQALTVNVDAAPRRRLVNLVMQRRARWLLERADKLFVDSTSSEAPQ